MLDFDVRRQHHHRRLREIPLNPPGRLQALGRELRRHPDIHHGQVRPFPADEFHEFRGVAGLADDLQPGAVQQARQAFAEKDVIVGQHHSRAARAHTTIMGPGRAAGYNKELASWNDERILVRAEHRTAVFSGVLPPALTRSPCRPDRVD